MLKLPRRNILRLAAAATALPAISRFAWAQSLSGTAGASARRVSCQRPDRYSGRAC